MKSRITRFLLFWPVLLFVAGCTTAQRIALQPVDNPIPKTPAGAYDISQVSKTPIATFQARPRYPFEMRRAGISGEGVVSFVVAADGTVKHATVVRATDVRFGQAALAAVSQWKFRPALLNDSVVECHMMVPIVFTLNEG